MLGAAQKIAPLAMQLAVFSPPHLIDRFVEMSGDMKLIMHDLGL